MYETNSVNAFKVVIARMGWIPQNVIRHGSEHIAEIVVPKIPEKCEERMLMAER